METVKDIAADQLDPEVCRAARMSRDARFDGRFFIGVKTTGIYCRPVCPVRPPLEKNVDYYPTAAAAASAGLRPCLRCRPERAAAMPVQNLQSAVLKHALQRINAGWLDTHTAAELAEETGLSDRHLRRLFLERVGATPQALAETRRLLFAKQLITDSDLPMTDVALASGYRSVRAFNDAVQRSWGRPPSQLRQATRDGSDRNEKYNETYIEITLPWRAPYDWQQVMVFLGRRTISGVESSSDDSYARSFRYADAHGCFRIVARPTEQAFLLQVETSSVTVLGRLCHDLRRALDLNTDFTAVQAQFAADPLLGPLVEAYPGFRMPGSIDPYEILIRAIVGQQVSVAGARTVLRNLVERYGAAAVSNEFGIERYFPTPAALAELPETDVGMPKARARTIAELSRRIRDAEIVLDVDGDTQALRKALLDVPGIGPWTVEYFAMRGICDPNAFPGSDLGLHRGAGKPGERWTVKALAAASENWQPWRAYAAVLLWEHDAAVSD